MIQYTAITSVLLAMSAISVAQERDGGFVPLFNGEDLTGWVLVNTPAETWSVRDEMLICSGKPIGEIRTKDMYQNFVLEVEWRHMKLKGNAGIFVWADDITARGVPFHRSVEVQVLENAYGSSRGHTTHGDIFPIHGATMTPINGRGGSRAFPTEERSKPSPDWNHYRIVCQDGTISLAVNGKVVTRGKDASPRKGYICLESEGGVVHYRNIRIKTLPDTPVAAEHIAIGHRGFRSVYSGLDMRGWELTESGKEHWTVNDWVLRYDGKSDTEAMLSQEIATKDCDLIFDVKFKEGFEELLVFVDKTDHPSVTVNRSDPLLKRRLAQPRQFNRFELAVRGDRMSVTMNNHRIMDNIEVKTRTRRLGLLPRGAIDLANVYVREIDH